jgi:hypothetical protein
MSLPQPVQELQIGGTSAAFRFEVPKMSLPQPV